MVDKRGLDSTVAEDAEPKRSRFGDASASAVTKPALSLEALEKAKRALQLKQKIQEKLKNLPQLQKLAAAQAQGIGAPGAAALAASDESRGFRPAPLRLDAQGREIDAQGNVIAQPLQVVSTLLVNQHALLRKVGIQVDLPLPAPEPEPAPAAPPEESAFFDPRMGARALKRMDRRKRSAFEFVQEGQYQKQAEIMRLKLKYGTDSSRRFRSAPSRGIGPSMDPNLIPLGGDPNRIPLGKRVEVVEEDEEEEAPDVEWWDVALLSGGSYETDVMDDRILLKESKMTPYVEHPIPLEPPAEAPPPPPQPLKLTKRELKKLKTQRRQAREKEKQELIRQGLLEPPKPKVKISNLMRVLGAEATADPTAVEKEVRRQMNEREEAHRDRNEANKLTPKERRDKKIRKLFDATGIDVRCALYRVGNLEHPSNRFKVDANAKENRLTGISIVTDDLVLVLVEGCPKSIKRYNKLMLRRIDWDAIFEEAPAKAGPLPPRPEPDRPRAPNSCHLVWEGTVKKAAFKDFHIEYMRTPAAARKMLADHGVGHYWDAVVTFAPDQAPVVEV